MLVVLALVAVAIAAWYLSYRARRRRLEPMSDALLPALADVLDETLDDLRAETDPRRAVIAAYARMERALAAYGLPRNPAEAPDEYLQRIFADLEVSRRATSRLTALFSWAKFSGHDVAPEMKQEAIEALEAVREELRAAEILAEQQRARAQSPSDASGREPDASRLARRPARCCSRRSRSASRSRSRPTRAALEVHVWLLVVLGLALLAFLGIVQAAYPRTPSPFAASLAPAARSPASAPQPLARLEREVSMAGSAAFDVHFRLRPTIVGARDGAALGAPRDRPRARSRACARRSRRGRLGARPAGSAAAVRASRRRDRRGRARPRRDGPGARLMELRELAELGGRLLDEVERAVVGKREQLELVLLGLLADGHVLLEDVPGLAKTLTARSFAEASGLGFSRVQFTPDLLPADVTGSSIWNQRDADFEFRAGPIFTHLLLADEINRAPPKTQAALLEAMQERQVTTDGVTRPLERPFLVLATQNPIEYEGTYPLPEAQLDRFLLRTGLRLPGRRRRVGDAGPADRAARGRRRG